MKTRRKRIGPTPVDPLGVEQHHWNTGVKENQQLNYNGNNLCLLLMCMRGSLNIEKI